MHDMTHRDDVEWLLSRNSGKVIYHRGAGISPDPPTNASLNLTIKVENSPPPSFPPHERPTLLVSHATLLVCYITLIKG